VPFDIIHTKAAAVVAGVVLETTMRKLCGDNSIPVGKLDKMNADLAKASVYDKNVQKEVTWLTGIRNSAAHGDPVSEADARDMIVRVRRFVTDHPTA
jgi:hypothetical protein